MAADKNIEQVVQQNINNYVRMLCSHVESWRSILQESAGSLRALLNQAEQLRHIEKVNLHHMEGFEETKKFLQCEVLSGIEDEISAIKINMSRLNKLNHDLRNKLCILEKSTLELEWNEPSQLLCGSATQPSLEDILQGGLEFCNYFASALRNISDNLKNMNIRKEDSMNLLQKSFFVDLDIKCVRYYVAITQYICNEGLVS